MKWIACFLFAGLLVTGSARAAPVDPEEGPITALPPAMREVDIDENLGKRLDPNLTFTDASGRTVRLGDYMGDGRPLVLTLAYFRCPMLCDLVLRGVATAMANLPFTLGDTYRALTVSFDPRDRPAQAAEKQKSLLAVVGKSRTIFDGSAWPFLVGDDAPIHALADSLGFRFAYDARSGQYAHPAAAFVLTPDGRISRYLYGTQFSARDLRLALVEAGSGKVGGIVDRVLLTCYQYDPATRRYGPFIRGFMRIGGFFILTAVTTLVLMLWRREKVRAAEELTAEKMAAEPTRGTP